MNKKWGKIKDYQNFFHLEGRLNIKVSNNGFVRIYVGNIVGELSNKNSIIISKNVGYFFNGTKKNYTLKDDWNGLFKYDK